MRVVVLMSTYNGEKYIREQIDSILAQRGNFQLDLWVRDDGSTDLTREILTEYANENKLSWYTGDNLGPAKSFIDLIHHCKGYDFYALADQDDYWMPEKISMAIKMMKNQKGLQLYFANAELVDSELRSLGRNVYRVSPCLDFETLCCAGGILGCTTVFNADLAKVIQEKRMPERLVMHDFYIDELCLARGGKITCDLRTVMKYRQHGKNVIGVSTGVLGTVKSRIKDITQKPKDSIAEQANEILNLYGKEIDLDKEKWLKKICNYRDSIRNRVTLACSRKTRYMNRNMGLKLRLSILLANR